MSWDYKISGKNGFDEELKLPNQAEIKQRDEMVNEWKLERAAYVSAKTNVARIEAVIKRATEAGQAKGKQKQPSKIYCQLKPTLKCKKRLYLVNKLQH